MNGVKPLMVGAGCLLSALIIWVVLKVLRTSMIVEFGIIATNTIRTVLLGAFVAAGLVAIALWLYPQVLDIIKNSSEAKFRNSSLAYRAKTSGPREIRDQLRIMKERRPRLSDAIAICLEQMDDMASQFDRFNHLIKSNDAEAMGGAMVGLKEIESTLYANFKWILNYLIAADEEDAPETNTFYDRCIERINTVVAANSRALDKGNQFLLEIADNISQIGAGGETILLDDWLKTIRDQSKKSLLLEER